MPILQLVTSWACDIGPLLSVCTFPQRVSWWTCTVVTKTWPGCVPLQHCRLWGVGGCEFDRLGQWWWKSQETTISTALGCKLRGQSHRIISHVVCLSVTIYCNFLRAYFYLIKACCYPIQTVLQCLPKNVWLWLSAPYLVKCEVLRLESFLFLLTFPALLLSFFMCKSAKGLLSSSLLYLYRSVHYGSPLQWGT